KHPLIASLAQDAKALCPSYMPAEKFATALMDILTGPNAAATDVAALRAQLQRANIPAAKALNALLADASLDAEAVRKKIEGWFNDQMDRVSGWYKRNAQRNILLIALAVTLILNASTVRMAQTMWETPALRAALVESAKARAQAQQEQGSELLPMVEYTNPNDPTGGKPVHVPQPPLSSSERQLMGQLTGWYSDLQERKHSRQPWGSWLFSHLVGWIITMLALSLGAPFWFDTLNRFINIRNAGRAPDEARTKNAPSSPEGAKA
ncbi:MAG TPA: hypothetical protein VEK84_17250, partial [Terriglobales bacterium]|nr:hypothetical protein [Terriglobales bacterium]